MKQKEIDFYLACDSSRQKHKKHAAVESPALSANEDVSPVHNKFVAHIRTTSDNKPQQQK